MIGIIPLETGYCSLTHFGIDITVFSIIFPHSWPAGITSQVNHRSIRPGDATGSGFVCRDFSTFSCHFPVERCCHVDSLRKHGPVQCIGGSVNLVNPVNARYSDLLHRFVLDNPDGFRPFLFLLGYSHRNIQQRSHFIFPDHRVQFCLAERKTVFLAGFKVRHHINRDFTHLPDLFFECHFFQPLTDVGFNLRIRRYGR